MAEYLYTKEFIRTPTDTLLLRDSKPIMSYIAEKIEALFHTKDDPVAQRAVKLRIFSDFKAIYEYDLEHAVLPDPILPFDTPEENEQFRRIRLLYLDFRMYLGDIFINYHERLARNNSVVLTEASPFVIDFNELFDTALAEYIRVILRVDHPIQIRRKETDTPEFGTIPYRGEEIKISTGRVQRKVHACAATFILPALLEHYLLMYLENTVIDQWLHGVEGKVLEPDEVAVYNRFLDMKKVGHGLIKGNRKKTMESIWSMGVKYGAFSDDRSMKEMLCGKEKSDNTLGAILKSDYARSRIRPEYLQILDYMFDKKLLNLRNSIAHGVSAKYDYLALAFVGVMVQMIWDIGANDVILGYEFG